MFPTVCSRRFVSPSLFSQAVPLARDSSPVRIDRCLCCEVSFAAARARAERVGAVSLVALQSHMDVGTGCGLCHPYLRRCLRTGETVFTSILEEDDEPA